jgi:hypothetical protein
MIGVGLTDESPMAKKKAAETPLKRAGRPKTTEGPKPGRIVMRASKAWTEWLERMKKERQWETSFFVREAFRAWAQREKVDPPPQE